MKRYIYGFGGLGRDLFNLCKKENIEIEGFIDDNLNIINNFNIKSFETLLQTEEKFKVIIAIGDPNIKRKIEFKLKRNNIELWNFISKHAILLTDEKKIGKGIIIYPFVFVGDSVIIEDNVLIGSNTTIGHDTKICKSSSIAFNCSIGGRVLVGDTSYIGSGVNIRDEVILGNNVIVGMGSTIVKSVEFNTKIYNKIKIRENENKLERIFK